MSPLDPPSDSGPRDASTSRVRVGNRPGIRVEVRGFRLTVVGGPCRGRTASFTTSPVRIGSAPEHEFPVEDRSVSRAHAEVRLREGGVLELRDLGSTNGVHVGGARVTSCELAPGTVIRLGRTDVRVDAEARESVALLDRATSCGPMVGAAPATCELFGLVRAAAPTEVGVLITGETGVGKELVARALHELSGSRGPFVVFDAATCQADLVQSRLFGHRAGAFTGAKGSREGAFRAAQGGTLFLDEIGELSLELQPNLLRALENREVLPLGADRPVPVSCRVLAATHRDLGALVEAGHFRRDLFHRLAILRIRVPPLRERPEDLAVLLPHLGAELGHPLEFEEDALRALEAHAWPGNVRELRNLLEALPVYSPGGPVTVGDLEAAGVAIPAPLPPPPGTLERTERAAILAALERCHGNRSRAARELGISRVTLWRRLRDWDLLGS